MKKPSITNPDQSKFLIDLGIKPDSSDFYYIPSINPKDPEDVSFDLYPKYLKGKDLRGIPAWSVGALLELLESNEKFGEFKIIKRTYYHGEMVYKDKSKGYLRTDDFETPIEAAIDMIKFSLNKN